MYLRIFLVALLAGLLASCTEEPINEVDTSPQLTTLDETASVGSGCIGESSHFFPNTLNLLKGDEHGNHGTIGDPTARGIKLPVYEGADFAFKGRVNGLNSDRPGYYIPYGPSPGYFNGGSGFWKWTIPWGNVYYADGTTEIPRNLRIEIRRVRSYYFSQRELRWIELDRTENGIDGAFYVNTFAGNENVEANLIYNERTLSVNLPGLDQVFHFYRGGSNSRVAVPDPADCVGLYSVCEARLVRADCNDPTDNRKGTRIYLGMGMDVWADEFADGNDSDFDHHGDAMFSRHRQLDASWRMYNGIALLNAGDINLDNYPPPLAW